MSHPPAAAVVDGKEKKKNLLNSNKTNYRAYISPSITNNTTNMTTGSGGSNMIHESHYIGDNYLHSHMNTLHEDESLMNYLPNPNRFASDQYESMYSPLLDDDTIHTSFTHNHANGIHSHTHSPAHDEGHDFHTADTETEHLLSSSTASSSSHYGSLHLSHTHSHRDDISPEAGSSWWSLTSLGSDKDYDYSHLHMNSSTIPQRVAFRITQFINSSEWHLFMKFILCTLLLLSFTSEHIYRKSAVTLLHNYRWSLYMTMTLFTFLLSMLGCIFTMPTILHNVHINGIPAKASLYIGVLDGIHVLCLLLSLSALPATTAIILQQLIIPLTLLFRMFRNATNALAYSSSSFSSRHSTSSSLSSTGYPYTPTGSYDTSHPHTYAGNHHEINLHQVFGNLLLILGIILSIIPGLIEWINNESYIHHTDGDSNTPALAEVLASLVILSISLMSGAASNVYKEATLSQYEVDMWLLNFLSSVIQLIIGLCLASLSLELQILGASSPSPIINPTIPIPQHQPLPPHYTQAPTSSSSQHTDDSVSDNHNINVSPAATTNATAAVHPLQLSNRYYDDSVYFSQTITSNYNHAIQCLNGIDNEPHDLCEITYPYILTALFIWSCSVLLQHFLTMQLLKRNIHIKTIQYIVIASSVLAIIIWLIPSLPTRLIPYNNAEWLIGGELTPVVWLILATLFTMYGSVLIQDGETHSDNLNEVDAWEKLDQLIIDDDEQRRILNRLIRQYGPNQSHD